MRDTVRHTTDVPVEILVESRPLEEPLIDVSRNGLSFRHLAPVEIGTAVRIRIADVMPAFEARARVIWCHPDGAAWQVGVTFFDADARYRARMVTQICAIERYRRTMQEQQGRPVSSHEAAMEWIGKYAQDVPHPDDDPA
ncbi:MAG: PilZ domain-containing protein [Gammaproteobacteria bacterium]|nr:PilZ domain-containing protein [Gammaproteobacteria bacterium]